MHTIVGVGCVKVFVVLEAFGDMSKAGNMSLFGGVFFMPIFYYLVAKIFKCSYRDVFDIFTICLVFTLMLARTNCLITGCCYGNPMHLFGLDKYQYPTREMELLYYLVFLLTVGRKVFLHQTTGNIYPIYMISYGLFRFITEWLRHTDGNSPIHIAHIWAINCFVLGLSIYFEMKRSHRLNVN
jgi:prolipoprotein diacylglyceryltransferase